MAVPAEYRIWLAEDNPGDVRLFREALNDQGFKFELTVAEDGQKAIALVDSSREGAPPDLIVLDVNLPRHDGAEVLRRIRSREGLSSTPVIMLTSSASPTDQATAGILGANLYIQKPSDLDELETIGTLVHQILKSR
jgi:two-component system, chemotaxis family, response regulator Rcp1